MCGSHIRLRQMRNQVRQEFRKAVRFLVPGRWNYVGTNLAETSTFVQFVVESLSREVDENRGRRSTLR